MTLLQGALNLAVRRGLIPTNPLRYLGKLPETERVPETLPVRQVHTRIGALDEHESLTAVGERSRAQAAKRANPTRVSPVSLCGIVLRRATSPFYPTPIRYPVPIRSGYTYRLTHSPRLAAEHAHRPLPTVASQDLDISPHPGSINRAEKGKSYPLSLSDVVRGPRGGDHD